MYSENDPTWNKRCLVAMFFFRSLCGEPLRSHCQSGVMQFEEPSSLDVQERATEKGRFCFETTGSTSRICRGETSKRNQPRYRDENCGGPPESVTSKWSPSCPAARKREPRGRNVWINQTTKGNPWRFWRKLERKHHYSPERARKDCGMQMHSPTKEINLLKMISCNSFKLKLNCHDHRCYITKMGKWHTSLRKST